MKNIIWSQKSFSCKLLEFRKLYLPVRILLCICLVLNLLPSYLLLTTFGDGAGLDRSLIQQNTVALYLHALLSITLKERYWGESRRGKLKSSLSLEWKVFERLDVKNRKTKLRYVSLDMEKFSVEERILFLFFSPCPQ